MSTFRIEKQTNKKVENKSKNFKFIHFFELPLKLWSFFYLIETKIPSKIL